MNIGTSIYVFSYVSMFRMIQHKATFALNGINRLLFVSEVHSVFLKGRNWTFIILFRMIFGACWVYFKQYVTFQVFPVPGEGDRYTSAGPVYCVVAIRRPLSAGTVIRGVGGNGT